jgi:hypothetical protein
MEEETPDLSPIRFQAGFWHLLPAFLGWTLILLCMMALLAAVGLIGRVFFRTDWPGLVAICAMISLLVPWLSSLVALLVPARRRLDIGPDGYVCRLGLETRRAGWASCGDIASSQAFHGARRIQFTGTVSRGPLVWTLLSWPSYIVLSAIGLAIAFAISLLSDTSSNFFYYDFPGPDDPAYVPGVFLKGEAAPRIEAALRRHHAAAQPDSAQPLS